ncbi:MAG: hypothetical protein EXX96DRAFT_48731 [Benjaminiella poitrasii]|nr:MAG: hypothetical protein EXX96DRAFT_48731 [Benjaminiella poitrasii]
MSGLPSLPSIQFILNDRYQLNKTVDLTTENANTETSAAVATAAITNNNEEQQQNANISSLPSELQQLSLSAPTSFIPKKYHNNDDDASWMMTAAPSTSSRRPAGASHTRSISLASIVLPPLSSSPNRLPHQTHRRSASAITAPSHDNDLYKMTTNNTQTFLPHIDEQLTTVNPDPYYRQQSSSSSQQKLLFDALNINENIASATDALNNPTVFLNDDGSVRNTDTTKPSSTPATAATAATAIITIKKKRNPRNSNTAADTILHEQESTIANKTENMIITRDEQTGRYYCPFCSKAFNRPSSLRIHTYSHTGEKPFVCLEEGCGRQFSVQSNMRRHLRVHRIEKSKIK